MDGEPAIPIRAVLPLQAHRDLLQLAETDLGGLSRTGVKVAFDVIEDGAEVKALVTVMDVGPGTLDAGVRVQAYRGRPVSYGGFVQWTKEER
jgi:hypothetical protein